MRSRNFLEPLEWGVGAPKVVKEAWKGQDLLFCFSFVLLD